MSVLNLPYPLIDEYLTRAYNFVHLYQIAHTFPEKGEFMLTLDMAIMHYIPHKVEVISFKAHIRNAQLVNYELLPYILLTKTDMFIWITGACSKIRETYYGFIEEEKTVLDVLKENEIVSPVILYQAIKLNEPPAREYLYNFTHPKTPHDYTINIHSIYNFEFRFALEEM